VWVLLSGGASSLAAAPVDGVRGDDLAALSRLLLGSGLDIAAMNAVRKRFSRWGGGRLAAAIAARGAGRVRCLVVSDVIGDDLAAIGSGPCVPDPVTAAELHARLADAALWNALPASLRAAIEAGERDPGRETPKAGDPVFARVETTLVASNRLSLDAVVARARALGLPARIESDALAGEASLVGHTLGAAVRALATSPPADGTRCLVWGGETTVTLGDAPGLGGRCQELALAAAGALADGAGDRTVALLAAGTDGRDGPTDAAGAIVDAGSWAAASAAGRDPARDLAAHDAHPALEAAGALVRPGLTGTNVMDVMVGLVL
jgi:hydroxypyruvate reductase